MRRARHVTPAGYYECRARRIARLLRTPSSFGQTFILLVGSLIEPIVGQLFEVGPSGRAGVELSAELDEPRLGIHIGAEVEHWHGQLQDKLLASSHRSRSVCEHELKLEHWAANVAPFRACLCTGRLGIVGSSK